MDTEPTQNTDSTIYTLPTCIKLEGSDVTESKSER